MCLMGVSPPPPLFFPSCPETPLPPPPPLGACRWWWRASPGRRAMSWSASCSSCASWWRRRRWGEAEGGAGSGGGGSWRPGGRGGRVQHLSQQRPVWQPCPRPRTHPGQACIRLCPALRVGVLMDVSRVKTGPADALHAAASACLLPRRPPPWAPLPWISMSAPCPTAPWCTRWVVGPVGEGGGDCRGGGGGCCACIAGCGRGSAHRSCAPSKRAVAGPVFFSTGLAHVRPCPPPSPPPPTHTPVASIPSGHAALRGGGPVLHRPDQPRF